MKLYEKLKGLSGDYIYALKPAKKYRDFYLEFLFVSFESKKLISSQKTHNQRITDIIFVETDIS